MSSPLSRRKPSRSLIAIALLVVAGHVCGEDYNAMINEALARQNAIVNQAQAQARQVVEANMRDPVVIQAWQQHQWQASQQGLPALDLASFAYQYAATAGFSDHGMRNYQRTSQEIAANEQAAWQGLRQAEAARGAAQAQLADSQSRNLQEAGRGLLGQSTFHAPNGSSMALPHTWPANSYQFHQGHQYFVDGGGNYWLEDPNHRGWWIALRR